MTAASAPQNFAEETAIDIRVDRAHSARVNDALCGGRTNFTADRELAWRIGQFLPLAPIALAASRQFLRRAVGHLARRGLSQFLDLGAGLPQSQNLHDLVRAVRGEARVVYVDHDPIVIAHLEALIGAEAPGGVGILNADITAPGQLLAAVDTLEVVDLAHPIALVMGAVLDHLPPDTEPGRLLKDIAARLAPGSALVLTHAAADLNDGAGPAADACREAGIEFHPRSRAEVEALFTDWDLLAPGMVPASRWRARGASEPDTTAPVYAGVAVLPRRRADR